MGSWQDWLVTAIAAIAAVLVVWRTLGAWKDSKPSAAGSPHCDSCAVADLAKASNFEAQGSKPKAQNSKP